MDLDLPASLTADGGIVTTASARQAGLTRYDLRTLVRRERLVRIHPGAFVPREIWDTATPGERHRLRAVGLVHSMTIDVAISHASAALVHQLPLWGPAPRHLHLCRTGAGRGWRRAGYTVHAAFGPESTVPDSAPPVVLPVLAALGLAEGDGLLAGVTALDAALARGLTTEAEARTWLRTLRRRPGVRTMTRVVEAADGLSESALETKARLVIIGLGYRVSLQVTLRTVDGEFVARVDLLIEELGVVIEVDGRSKYQREDGTGSVEVLLSEKHRESAIRDLGYGLVRVDNQGLDDPATLDRRIRDAAGRASPAVRRPPPSETA